MIKSKIKSVPNKLHVKTGDTVVVINGKSKNHVGKVIKVFPKLGKVVVEGANIVKKHMKPTQMNTQGQIVEKEMPIFSSKVMLWDKEMKKGTRVRYEMRDGKKVKISVVSGKEI